MKNLRVSSVDDRERLGRIMEQVRRIEIRSRRLLDDTLAGLCPSVFRGRGLDFDSVREYVAGDDVRAIDWNVTARVPGRAFVKQFHEERELTVWLLVDISASGEFGSAEVTKRELAAEVACVLALAAVRNDDKVGLIMFSDRVEVRVPPARGRTHAMRLVREILTCRPSHRGTDLAAAVELVGRLARRRAVMFLMSDFELPDDGGASQSDLDRALRPVAARHDVIAVEVRDPRELALPDLGLVSLEDAETGQVVVIDTSRRRTKQRFAEAAETRRAELHRRLGRLSVEILPLETSRPYERDLFAFFAARERRRAQ
jgi:uncharacterized protein (DUF58 family)